MGTTQVVKQLDVAWIHSDPSLYVEHKKLLAASFYVEEAKRAMFNIHENKVSSLVGSL